MDNSNQQHETALERIIMKTYKMNIPMALTWSRIVMIPVMLSLLYAPGGVVSAQAAEIAATVIFVVAGVTDWLDGVLARALKMQSAFGAFLDPVADKLLVASTLIALVHMGKMHSLIAIIIIGREISVSALREWMAQVGKSGAVAVASIGKVKTAAQMVGIPFLLCDWKFAGSWGTREVGTPLIWIAALLTVVSMVHYMKAAAGGSVEKRAGAGVGIVGKVTRGVEAV